ncbi:hypothetical protein HPP92_017438 [Vanilla planifolia]|uniref:Isopenicillin N synthase-like Fe(2+) 2OG dioxygenase domain-containing protein n=1 Tax=Vanilla planifolia TaxID=51239 RepID=A0A835Q7Z7_VANPL|nr:hypothetical protein HPP92_017438 [Vanilla planifolia]
MEFKLALKENEERFMDDAHCSVLEFPTVDLGGLVEAGPASESWRAAQQKVARALVNYGGFEAIFDDVGSQLKEELMGRVVPEVMKNEANISRFEPVRSNVWFFRQDLALKTMHISNPGRLSNEQHEDKVVFFHEDDSFRNVIYNYEKQMQELVKLIHRMILMSLDMEEYYESHIKSVDYFMKLTEYFNDTSIDKTKIGMPPHKDVNYVNIICQHEVDGLEIKTSEGEWIRIATMPNSFTVLLGEASMAWTNGIFKAPKHRVKIEHLKKRYSVIFGSLPSSKCGTIKPLDKFLDNNHSLLYKSFNYHDYIKFCVANGGNFVNDLKSYLKMEEAKSTA